MELFEAIDKLETNAEEAVSRRGFLSRITSAGLGVTALGLVAHNAQASGLLLPQPRRQVEACAPNAMNEKQFRMGVIGPAELSLVTSKIAVNMATQRNAKEFAGFELGEAIAVTGVLTEMKTPVPMMDAKSKATLAKIKAAPKGDAFDMAYIQAQFDNHVFLRDLAQNYLNNSKGKTSMAEVHTRHMATLMLAVFKEHVAITKRISGELKA